MKVVHMNPRMISPLKRPKSANYWFRLAIPTRYRTRVGQSEVKLSLQTADIREARRLCGLMQGDWLAKFQAFDVADRIDAERTGADLVDRFFEVEAERHGGLDAVMNYELDGLGLAESAYLEAITVEDILGPGWADGPVIEWADEAYPDYRDPPRRGMIASRRKMLENSPCACVLPGREAAQRALSLRFWQIAVGFVEQAFAHAGKELETGSAAYAAAGERYLRRLLGHPVVGLCEMESALPAPPSLLPENIAVSAVGPVDAPPRNTSKLGRREGKPTYWSADFPSTPVPDRGRRDIHFGRVPGLVGSSTTKRGKAV
jgi:hypothetical protein